uniref:Uncharacterized protein n=1 Tax=Panagrolaimus sp. ES5 TaxID=591445 RepID=A0AC34G9C2_9BILA
METEFEKQPERPISWMEESPKNKKAEESEHSNIRQKETTLTATTATTQNDDSTLKIKSTQNPSQKSVAAEN